MFKLLKTHFYIMTITIDLVILNKIFDLSRGLKRVVTFFIFLRLKNTNEEIYIYMGVFFDSLRQFY